MRIRIRLALLLISVAASAQAAEVPFGGQQVITTAADGDGDGDLDVLSASQLNDTIAWYEDRRRALPLSPTDGGAKWISRGNSRRVVTFFPYFRCEPSYQDHPAT
jgi:hypothetical protein